MNLVSALIAATIASASVGVGPKNRPADSRAKAYYVAIRNGDDRALQALVRRGFKGIRDKDGNTPLLFAALDGKVSAVRALLDAGADPNEANASGSRPLMWCAGDSAKVKLLLAHGAHVNVRSKQGRTPLMLAAAYVNGGASTRMLLEHGANPNVADGQKTTPLMLAASNNAIEPARLLLEHGAKVDAADFQGFTALIAAAGNGPDCEPLVKLLLDHGANPNAQTLSSKSKVLNGIIAIGKVTALQGAAASSEAATKDLLDAGAEVDAKDMRGYTALVMAVGVDHPKVGAIRLLLEHGADRAAAMPWVKRYANPEVMTAFGLNAPGPRLSNGQLAVGVSPGSMRRSVAKALVLSQQVSSKFLATGG